MDINHAELAPTYSPTMPYHKNSAEGDIKAQVRDSILENSTHLAKEDRAILLAIAHLESGFDPLAKAKSTTASGVFQIVKRTAQALGLNQDEVFNYEKNIKAGIKLFQEITSNVKSKYPNLRGDKRAAMIYVLFHDGPSLRYGGEEIARKHLLPRLTRFRRELSR